MSNDARASSESTGFELFFGFDLDAPDFELDFGASSSSGTEIRVWHCGHFTAFPRAASGTERTFSQLVHFTLTGIGQQPSKSIVNAGRSRPSLSLIRQIQGKRPFVAACQMPRPRREGVDNGFRNQRDNYNHRADTERSKSNETGATIPQTVRRSRLPASYTATDRIQVTSASPPESRKLFWLCANPVD